ncbi:MAG: hypothetical protein QXU18_10200 [Thermoplasmatales archaeon]
MVEEVRDSFKLVAIVGTLVIIAVLVWAFMLYRPQLGLQGVGITQSIMNAFDSVPNGIATVISAFSTGSGISSPVRSSGLQRLGFKWQNSITA